MGQTTSSCAFDDVESCCGSFIPPSPLLSIGRVYFLEKKGGGGMRHSVFVASRLVEAVFLDHDLDPFKDQVNGGDVERLLSGWGVQSP